MLKKYISLPIGDFCYDAGEGTLSVAKGKEPNEATDSLALVRYIEHPATQKVEELLKTSLSTLVLQVTQNCNLRCDYCAYSGKYYNRVHSIKRMTLDIAQRAIDFFFSHTQDSRDVVIGFYGGEPLLEMALIKECVAYIKSAYWGKSVSYITTTNATLLTGEVVDFLVNNDVSVMVSFDGPKEIHDINRHFENGRGSFDLIMKNLMQIKERYPEFYAKIQTNTVLAPEEDYSCVKEYFDADTIISELSSKLSLVRPDDSKVVVKYSDRLLEIQNEEITKVLLWMLKKIRKDQVSKLYHSYNLSLRQKYNHLYLYRHKREVGHPGGPCIPGYKKVFVDVSGNFYPCEKVSECEETRIGSIMNGFDYDKIVDMLNIARLTADECSKCWCFTFCNQCVASSMEHNKVSRDKKLSMCAAVRANTEQFLKEIAFLRYFGCDLERAEK